MKETSKAQKRRCNETGDGIFDWGKIFRGDICDVGPEKDPLVVPSATSMTYVDLPDGAGDDLRDQVKDRKFDLVHGSQVAEHAVDPVKMISSWIACLKPGGFIVASVPDWERYEHKVWPSKWNAGHQTAWTLNKQEVDNLLRDGYSYGDRTPSIPLKLLLLPDWLNQFLNTDKPCEILLCRLVDTSDHSLPDTVDQTFPDDGAEVFLEFVLKRI